MSKGKNKKRKKKNGNNRGKNGGKKGTNAQDVDKIMEDLEKEERSTKERLTKASKAREQEQHGLARALFEAMRPKKKHAANVP